nr:beta-galactosidase [Lachnospiraceae bacterium]
LPPSKHYTFDPTRNDAAIGMDLINDTDDKGWRLPYEDYPFATCEIGSGLPIAYKRRSVISPMDAYALSLVKLGCGNNLVGYYMYHGGTNKIGALSTLQESGATGYPNDYPILNYDFNTCLTQYGEVRGQYRLLNLLHLFINDFGDRLAPMEYTPSESYVNENDKVHLRYCMRTDGESGFVFINHYQRFLSLSDIDDAVIDTGKVVFPPINVRGETAFILPFKLKLGEEELIYSTAQLLYKDRDTVFFASIPGIKPVFSFKDMDIFTMSEDEIEIKKTGDLNIVSIPWEKSLYLRKLDTGVYLGEGCDLYIKDGRISSAEAGDYSYLVWNNGGFERIVCEEGSKARPILTMEPCDEPYSPPFIEEFRLGKERPLKWYSLKADTEDGFISIDLKCDVAQIYADKELRADLFCFGQPWRFPAKLIYGRESYLVCTEFNKDVYIDP